MRVALKFILIQGPLVFKIVICAICGTSLMVGLSTLSQAQSMPSDSVADLMQSLSKTPTDSSELNKLITRIDDRQKTDPRTWSKLIQGVLNSDPESYIYENLIATIKDRPEQLALALDASYRVLDSNSSDAQKRMAINILGYLIIEKKGAIDLGARSEKLGVLTEKLREKRIGKRGYIVPILILTRPNLVGDVFKTRKDPVEMYVWINSLRKWNKPVPTVITQSVPDLLQIIQSSDKKESVDYAMMALDELTELNALGSFAETIWKVYLSRVKEGPQSGLDMTWIQSIELLGKLKLHSRETLDRLLPDFVDAKYGVRYSYFLPPLIEGLGEKDYAESLLGDYLSKNLSDQKMAGVIRILQVIKAKELAARIEPFLTAKDFGLRVAAYSALISFGEPYRSQALPLLKKDVETIDAFMNAFQLGDAIELLGSQGDESTIAILMERLKNLDQMYWGNEIRDALVHLLTKYPKNKKDVEAQLYELLKNPNRGYAIPWSRALEILGELKSPDIIPYALEELKAKPINFEQKNRQEAALNALSSMQGKLYLDQVLDLYLKSDNHGKAQIADFFEKNYKNFSEEELLTTLNDKLILNGPLPTACDALCGMEIDSKELAKLPQALKAAPAEVSSATTRSVAGLALQSTFLLQASPFCPKFKEQAEAQASQVTSAGNVVCVECQTQRQNTVVEDIPLTKELKDRLENLSGVGFSNSLYFQQYLHLFLKDLQSKKVLEGKVGYTKDLKQALFDRMSSQVRIADRLEKAVSKGDSFFNSYALASTLLSLGPENVDQTGYQLLEKSIDPKDHSKVGYVPSMSGDSERGSAARRVPVTLALLMKDPKNPAKREDLLAALEGYKKYLPSLMLATYGDPFVSGFSGIDRIFGKTWHSGEDSLAPYYLHPTFPFVTASLRTLEATAIGKEKGRLAALRGYFKKTILRILADKSAQAGSFLTPEEARALAGLALIPLLDESDSCAKDVKNRADYSGVLTEDAMNSLLN